MKTGELRQYTDCVGGNTTPIVLPDDHSPRVAFVTYFKGEYGVHTLERKDPLQTALVSDFGEPGQGPPVDFQPPLTHTLVAANKRTKKPFEKMFLDGRPPVNVGITSGGDIYGGTQVTFSDVLGDKQINFFVASISQYRTIAGSYVNLSRRFNYAIQGFSQTDFFYGQVPGAFYDPSLTPFISRDQALATRTTQGGSIFGVWPLSRYRRVEVSGGFVNFNESYSDAALQQYSQQYQQQTYGTQLFNNGNEMPLSVAYVQETTVFREFGPLSGNTMRVSYTLAPAIGSLLSRQTFDADLRYYQRLGGSGLLALRARAFKSNGTAADFNYFGGNADLRGFEYLQFIGNQTYYANAELRFPLIEAMLTPIGVLGGVRGVFFAGAGGAFFNDASFQFWSNKDQIVTPIVGYTTDNTGQPVPIFGNPVQITGLRLVDGRASYGFGLETFALGFPIHFDWAWRTLMNRDWEDAVFASVGGSQAYRQAQFKVWIGFDF
jgi:hypothetical protein